MTDKERDMLIETLKRDVPQYFERLRQRVMVKTELLKKCINIASSDNDNYQTQINNIYNSTQIYLSDVEVVLLNYICLIRHKEKSNKDNQLNNDEEIHKWVEVLKKYVVEDESVFSLLKTQSLQLIKKYKVRNKVGRPLNSGKQVFIYNGKEYQTIQACANDYGITKQGMRKRLRKLNII